MKNVAIKIKYLTNIKLIMLAKIIIDIKKLIRKSLLLEFKIQYIAFIIMLMSCSCKKFVKVDLPDSQLTGTVIFQDATTADAAMKNIYSKLISNNSLLTGNTGGLSFILGHYADELTYLRPDVLLQLDFFQNNVRPSNSIISSSWSDAYNLIFAANAIIEGMDQSPLAVTEKDRIKGEAIFVRAFIHFYLLNLYGKIPYIKTTDYRINSIVTKMDVNEIYAAVVADLKEAQLLIPEDYKGADRARPNRSVVTAMLARVYLYTQNWADAEAQSTAIISNTAVYKWVDDLNQVFLKTSTGTLWQLSPAQGGDNTVEAKTYIIFSTPPPGSVLSDNLMAAFEPNDLRKVQWVGTITDGVNTWHYAFKYKQYYPTPPASLECPILFRLEEQYLIRAEARAKQGNILGAQADLNKIRNRAGLENTSANTESTLLDAILQERRVELFTEHGHRFFDLKRTGNLDVVLDAVKPNWDTYEALWPLPENELRLNSNLKPQNIGY